MNVLAWNCWGLGSTSVVWILTDEVKSKRPILIFLAKTKASSSKVKGILNKLELTQGISIPSDGRSGGLAMLWTEGTNIHFKSCFCTSTWSWLENMACRCGELQVSTDTPVQAKGTPHGSCWKHWRSNVICHGWFLGISMKSPNRMRSLVG